MTEDELDRLVAEKRRSDEGSMAMAVMMAVLVVLGGLYQWMGHAAFLVTLTTVLVVGGVVAAVLEDCRQKRTRS